MNSLSRFLVESILNEAPAGVIVLLPGGFKPPHGGHLELAKKYASEPNVSEVRILIGPKEREGITRDQSIAVWNNLLVGNSNIKVIPVSEDNPLSAAYKYIETAKPGTYALAASSKGEDYVRVKKFVDGHAEGAKYHRPNVNVVELPLDTNPLLYTGRKDNLNGKGISASVLRSDLKSGDFDNFKTNYPGQADSTLKNVFKILTGTTAIKEYAMAGAALKIKAKFQDFLSKLKTEKNETKEAFKKLVQSVKNGNELSDEEKEQIGNQLKDVFEAIGLTAATVLPGGTLYFILIEVLKLEKYTMPSAFITEKVQLNEGGAAGHMTHPYEDYNLTFDDVKNMIDAALSGQIEFAQEKLDGQNLMVTYKDGQVRGARNKGQVKDAGASSLTVKQVEDMFAGKGPIQVAFGEAMKDLETAINKLTPAQKEKFFANGKKFVNLEVLYPETANVVPYGATQLRLHNITEYDPAGNVIGTDAESAVRLQGALRQVEAENQKTYQIRVTDPVKINKSADYEKQRAELDKIVDDLRAKFNLKAEDKIGMYLQEWWKRFISGTAKGYGYKVPDNVMQQLINRWAFSNKEVNIKAIRDSIKNEDFKNWVTTFDKSDLATQKKVAVKPIENLFLKLGVYTLKNVSQLVAINPNDSVRKMKADLDSAIEQIKAASQTADMGDDDAAMKFLKRELERLKDIGGFKAIVPLEGVVFKYDGKLYKLTGAFAPINQILGYLKF